MSKATVTKLETSTRRPPMTQQQFEDFKREIEDPMSIIDRSQSRFKAGDTVRVIKPEGIIVGDTEEEAVHYSDPAGHVDCWVSDMDNWVGHEFTLLPDTEGPNGWHLPNPDMEGLPFDLQVVLGVTMGFIEDWLEPVEAA